MSAKKATMDDVLKALNALTISNSKMESSIADIGKRLEEVEKKSDKGDSISVDFAVEGDEDADTMPAVSNKNRRRADAFARGDTEADSNLTAINAAKKNRRNTMFPEPELDKDLGPSVGALVVPAHEVQEDEKIKKITVKSFQRLLQVYTEYKETSPDPRLNI